MKDGHLKDGKITLDSSQLVSILLVEYEGKAQGNYSVEVILKFSSEEERI